VTARQSGEPGRHLERPFERRSLRYDLRDDTGLPRLVGAEPLGEQEELLRARRSEQSGHAMQPAGAGEDAEGNLGEAEDRGLVRDPEVERQRELECAAEAVAVDGRDRRLRQSSELLVDTTRLVVVAEHVLRRAVLELGDVRAGRERPSFAGDDDRTARADDVRREGLMEDALDLARDRIQLLGPVEVEDRNLALARDGDRAHRSNSFSSSAASTARRPTSGSRSRGRRCSVPQTLTIATGRPCSESTGAEAPKSDSSSSPTQTA